MVPEAVRMWAFVVVAAGYLLGAPLGLRPPIGATRAEPVAGIEEREAPSFRNSIGMVMIELPGESRSPDNGGVAQVAEPRMLYLASTETTNAQYRLFLKETGYPYGGTAGPREAIEGVAALSGMRSFMGDHKPVVVVSWVDAVRFCQWLSDREGAIYRLPTVSEWAQACAGTEEGVAGASVLDAAWCAENAEGATHPVATKAASAYGFHDMRGNAWEWTSTVVPQDLLDAERAELADAGLSVTAYGPKGTHAWFCGGGFASSAAGLRCDVKGHYRVDAREVEIGFRVLCVGRPAR